MAEVIIKLKSYIKSGPNGLDKAVEYILNLAKKCGVKFRKPVYLPTKIRKFYYTKAPQIYKRHGEHIEKRSFSVILSIAMNKHLEDTLTKSDLPGEVLAYTKAKG